jgi:ribonuclease HII
MIIGIDEVGRGPGAGPIVFCAFTLLDETVGAEILAHFPKGELHDSKKLSEMRRVALSRYFEELKGVAKVSWTLAERSAKDIDSKGLSLCIKECLEECCGLFENRHKLSSQKMTFKLDGGLHLGAEYSQETIIKGDEKVLEIACASIIAKVYRDSCMKEEAVHFKEYRFDKNKGYLTKEHLLSIQKYGPTKLHRMSFLRKIYPNRERQV